MPPRLLRTSMLVLAAAAALVAAGCGSKHAIVTEAETEGLYLDVGGLDYQVQISRNLTPGIVPDTDYLKGLPETAVPPTGKETWFAVFVRVQNQTDEAQPSAHEFEIVDTVGRRYEPIELDPEDNAFAYRPQLVPPGALVPAIDSTGAASPTQGALLLFKLSYQSLQNRPIKFHVKSPAGPPQEAEVDLDV